MEKDAKKGGRVTETDFLLQWGNRKRLRCVKVKNDVVKDKSEGCLIRKKITSRVDRRVVVTEPISPQPHRTNRESPINNGMSLKRSPEKEDRYYTTRGSLGFDDNGNGNGKVFMDGVGGFHGIGVEESSRGGFIWPKLLLSLSNKEKEEDFMAMKGCKLPQRPKKRPKPIQRSLLPVIPGAWLSDLCQERYEVREKKTCKKRPRGLKAMGGMESDSE